MKLTIQRKASVEPEVHRTVTLGRLLVDGEFECYTEEPPMRDDSLFIAGESALLLGLYVVSLPKSPFFSRNVPLLASPQFRGPGGAPLQVAMRILPGHYTLDNYSVGIIVGKSRSHRNVHHTRAAYDQLMVKLKNASAPGPRQEAIELEIAMGEE